MCTGEINKKNCLRVLPSHRFKKQKRHDIDVLWIKTLQIGQKISRLAS